MLFGGQLKCQLLKKVCKIDQAELKKFVNENKDSPDSVKSSALETILFLVHILMRACLKSYEGDYSTESKDEFERCFFSNLSVN